MSPPPRLVSVPVLVLAFGISISIALRRGQPSFFFFSIGYARELIDTEPTQEERVVCDLWSRGLVVRDPVSSIWRGVVEGEFTHLFLYFPPPPAPLPLPLPFSRSNLCHPQWSPRRIHLGQDLEPSLLLLPCRQEYHIHLTHHRLVP